MDDFVSTSISRMRKKLKESKNENDARIEEIQDTLDILLAKFRSEAMSTHSTKKFDITGFSNLVKLQLLLSGNPTEIIENKGETNEILEDRLEEIVESGKLDEIIEELGKALTEENERQNNE